MFVQIKILWPDLMFLDRSALFLPQVNVDMGEPVMKGRDGPTKM